MCIGTSILSLLYTRMHACRRTSMSTNSHVKDPTAFPRSPPLHCLTGWWSNERRVRGQRFGSRMKAAHSFQLHFCQVTYTMLLLLGQSFSNSLIQNNLILAQGQRGDPSLVSFTWLDLPYCYCVTLFDLVLFLTSYQQSYRRELWNSLWQLIVLLICNVNSGYYISDRY